VVQEAQGVREAQEDLEGLALPEAPVVPEALARSALAQGLEEAPPGVPPEALQGALFVGASWVPAAEATAVAAAQVLLLKSRELLLLPSVSWLPSISTIGLIERCTSRRAVHRSPVGRIRPDSNRYDACSCTNDSGTREDRWPHHNNPADSHKACAALRATDSLT
jgi:hypothetical protein